MIPIYKIPINGNTVSGTFSINTLKVSGGILEYIYIKATTNDTSFHVKVVDDANNIIYETSTKPVGFLRDRPMIPIIGIHTITIYGAKRDELFTGCVAIREGK